MIDINGILGALQGQAPVGGHPQQAPGQPHAAPGQPQAAQPAPQAANGGGSNAALMLGGGALAGLAGGMLMGKGGRKLVGKAAKYGAVAALGGRAYHAVSRRRGAQAAPQGQAPTAQQAPAQAPVQAAPAAIAPATSVPATADYGPAPENTAYLPPASDEPALEARGQSLLRAMIAAAKCDGDISYEERGRIAERMSALNLDAESRAFVEAELARPFRIEDVIADVNCPEHAAEICAASLVAIDREGAVERGYLAMLAARLGLDSALVEEIHAAAAAEEAASAA